jgi:hypothetical protein
MSPLDPSPSNSRATPLRTSIAATFDVFEDDEDDDDMPTGNLGSHPLTNKNTVSILSIGKKPIINKRPIASLHKERGICLVPIKFANSDIYLKVVFIYIFNLYNLTTIIFFS